MNEKIGGNIICKKCGNEYDDTIRGCWFCRQTQVHDDVTKFIKDLQTAQKATRKHNTHFGPLPNKDKSLIKTIRTTPEQMDETIKNANTVINNIPPWNCIKKPTYEELEQKLNDHNGIINELGEALVNLCYRNFSNKTKYEILNELKVIINKFK